MQPLKAKVTRAIPFGSCVETCDNSGAKAVRVFTVMGLKTVKGRIPSGGVGDLVMGTRIKFEDNALVVLKDDKGNPKGTIFKGPIAKEACERWPGIAKIASIVV